MEPYLGEIKMDLFAGAPRGWAQCNGQQLSIKDNMPLFSVIGFTYGGDGKTFFNLPDMRGRAPIGAGEGDGLLGYCLGDKAGAEKPVTKDVKTGEGGVGVLQTTGGTDGGQPVITGTHSNMQPSVALNFIIALVGLFPQHS